MKATVHTLDIPRTVGRARSPRQGPQSPPSGRPAAPGGAGVGAGAEDRLG